MLSASFEIGTQVVWIESLCFDDTNFKSALSEWMWISFLLWSPDKLWCASVFFDGRAKEKNNEQAFWNLLCIISWFSIIVKPYLKHSWNIMLNRNENIDKPSFANFPVPESSRWNNLTRLCSCLFFSQSHTFLFWTPWSTFLCIFLSGLLPEWTQSSRA